MKCRKRPLEGSKLCPMHISYEEGKALFGMFMWEVFLTVFARKYMR